ncbi:DUF6563 family protein [Sediminibacter sp. Hel_I_10]|uniref:DUF6563 family protein n=1 Tax=Sediminibacter sp. Hel_I_10 TaxID=1392490 RepID=UPI000565F10F|nr:DUF6563 family protein [Sediminibacter sp. Hel_I_10]
MKIVIAKIFMIGIMISNLNAQEFKESNGVFINFEQFKSNEPCPLESIDLKERSELFLSVNNIESDCKFKKVNKIIAISFDNEIYYNMRFNVEFLTKNKFSKLQVKGKYCAFMVDESYPENIQGQAGFNTDGLIGEIILGANGKNKIYYLDTSKGYKTKVLTKNRLKELLSQEKDLLDSFNKENDITAELYLNYLERLNKKFENK